MNRSFHAFAVLLVSLAGGMTAATWTSKLTTRRPVVHLHAKGQASAPLYCSCNPDCLTRFEQGCARDKTTGELYGCGLGLGNNVTSGKSVLGGTARCATAFVAKAAIAIGQRIAEISWHDLATQSKRLETELAAMHAWIPDVERPAMTPDRSHEQDYAAAELAAAGSDPNRPSSPWLSPLYRAVSADEVSNLVQSTVDLLGRANRQWERQSRLWLVENGLHRQWDDAEESMLKEKLASARLQMEEENFDRWFENFPPPITRPNRLINPIEPLDDSEESRRMILAAAKVLETLSGLLHDTAENLARQAEQDVAELHKLKSGLEERR